MFHIAISAIQCFCDGTCTNLIGYEKRSVEECCASAANGGIDAAYYNDGSGCTECLGKQTKFKLKGMYNTLAI